MQRRYYVQQKRGTRWIRFKPSRGYLKDSDPAAHLVNVEPGAYRARFVDSEGVLSHYGPEMLVESHAPQALPMTEENRTPQAAPPVAPPPADTEPEEYEPETEPDPAPPATETIPNAMPFPAPNDGELMRFMWMYRLIRDDIKQDNATFLQLMSQQMNVALLAEQTRARESLELASTHHQAVAKAQQEMVQEMRKRSEHSEQRAEQANAALVQVMQEQDDEPPPPQMAEQQQDPKAALIEQLPMLLAAAKELGILGAT